VAGTFAFARYKESMAEKIERQDIAFTSEYILKKTPKIHPKLPHYT
jgi:hypothetical protein